MSGRCLTLLVVALSVDVAVASTAHVTHGLGLANRVRNANITSANATLLQTEKKDFAATQREWFLRESQAAERIIADAREKIKTTEATLVQQANFRRARAEEVRRQAKAIKDAGQQRKLAARSREREFAAFRKTASDLTSSLSELDQAGKVSEAMPPANSDGRQRTVALAVPPAKAGKRWVAATLGLPRVPAVSPQETSNDAAKHDAKDAQAPSLILSGHQTRRLTAEIRDLRRGLQHNVRRSIMRQLRHAAKEDVRSKSAYHRAEEEMGEHMGHMTAQLIQLKSQIASSLELSNEKAAELDAAQELLRATTQHLQEVQIANKGNAESMMDCDDAV